MAWKAEVEKKPSSMTATDALQILGLGPQNLEADEAVIRKAYFRMAQQYHPDKNPKGRKSALVQELTFLTPFFKEFWGNFPYSFIFL